MILIQLFFEFFKIGLFAIGGGLAAIPFLEHLSSRTGWFPLSLISEMIAISEATPGPLGIKMATYVGFSVAGWAGGLAATLGVI
ncbi:MAG TPA: chromate transporter, partial [Clostridiaceae bacterium]|nr:chromate transporter [Clostridiaceae bacterium]